MSTHCSRMGADRWCCICTYLLRRECGYGKCHSHEDAELGESRLVRTVHGFAKDNVHFHAANKRKRDLNNHDAECFSSTPTNGMKFQL
ncbi:hypothetical protein VNO78_09759 [Psophocarpus tetragonolobus]|uniref:Uncharacterized protein n=1 Tax=Psophocarpus tetragonolobus TaxID=3891 RepID=A0AAN9XTF6_PSOTE